jgi:hypothetical protein
MPIRPRAFPVSRLANVPRHWLAGSVLATHLANGVGSLFPAGERFFVRSVRHFSDVIERDPELAEAVRGFAGQEGWHAGAHERHIRLLEEQGYRIRPLLRAYERIGYGLLEPAFSPVMRLAVTAAAEHFTAIMAENFLTEGLFRDIHPAMGELLGWHASEEIEHRSVAFEVLRRVDDRYAVRIAGLVIAATTLAGFWIAATLYLLSQEPGIGKVALREGPEFAKRQPFGERVFGRGIRAYLRRDFHPADAKHLDALAASFLSRFEAGDAAPSLAS